MNEVNITAMQDRCKNNWCSYWNARHDFLDDCIDIVRDMRTLAAGTYEQYREEHNLICSKILSEASRKLYYLCSQTKKWEAILQGNMLDRLQAKAKADELIYPSETQMLEEADTLRAYGGKVEEVDELGDAAFAKQFKDVLNHAADMLFASAEWYCILSGRMVPEDTRKRINNEKEKAE